MTAPGFGSGTVNSGNIRIRLVEPENRKRSQMDIAEALSGSFRRSSAARVIVSQEQSMAACSAGRHAVQYVIKAPNLDKLREVLPFLRGGAGDSVFTASDVNLKFNKPSW